MEVLMRRARGSDADALNLIFNQAVEDGNSNLDIDFKDREYRLRWLAAHDKRHPVYVGEMDGQVVCWVSLSPYSERYTYDFVADLSIYVRRDLRGQGLGTLLLKFIEQQATELGYYKIVLSVYGGNRAALHAYRRAGYRDVGVFRNHGYHKGRLVDIIYMERLLVPDMEFLKEYYSKNYPFYAQHFAREKAEEEALLRRNGMLPPLEGQQEDDYEEVPVEDPSALPEGIVRFLKSKPKPPPQPLTVSRSVEDREPLRQTASLKEQSPDAGEQSAPRPIAQEAPEVSAVIPPQEPPEAPAAEEKPPKPPRQKRTKTEGRAPKTSKPKPPKEPKEDGPLEGQLNLEDVILSK